MNMNKPMISSTMDEQSPAMKIKKRGSWDLLADMAADMVNSLEIGDGFDNAPSGCSSKGMQQTNSLPAINNRYPSMSVPTKGRGILKRSGGNGYAYDPSAVDLRSQAKQQKPARSAFSSLAIPTARKKEAKKNPLMEFHERRNKAENEYKKQEMSKNRRQQLRDHDEEKSLSSSNSFFDFLVRSAPDDLTGDETSERDDHGSGGGAGATTNSNGGGMKRTESTHSMASFFSLFGDNEEEIAKLSSSKPASNMEKEEDPHLQAAVTQSKSVKGHRVFAKGKQAADRGNWKKAVAYYHIALVKQREYYGEDHLVTSSTLNSLGLALMNLGEHFGALTALEEALHIRQEALGAGAKEVAETTSNIWMVLKASQDDGEP